jgi:hypothetical protein
MINKFDKVNKLSVWSGKWYIVKVGKSLVDVRGKK